MKTMKKVHGICLVMMGLLLVPVFVSHGWAALYSGYVGNRTDGTGALIDTAGGMSATGNSWATSGSSAANKGVRLDWTVDSSEGNWVYTYTFRMASGALKDIKNFDLQVASDFIASDLVSALVTAPASGVTGPAAGATLPAGISENSGLVATPIVLTITRGYQWSCAGSADNTFTLTITTTRAPVWGDFFVFSSNTTNSPSTYLTAYNTGFGAAKAPFPATGGVYNGLVAVPGGPAPNNVPVLAANTGITMGQDSGQTTITNSMLRLTDADNPAASTLVYTLTGVPALGTLINNGSPLVVSGTFTQADLDSNRISFTAAALQNGVDSFSFTYTDGIAPAQGPATFNINITAAPHVMGGAVPYQTLKDAFDNATDTIRSLAITFDEELLFSRPGVSLQFIGGFDGSYENENNGWTTIKGSLTIKDGALMVRNVRIQ